MFPARYYPSRFFPRRYFQAVGAAAAGGPHWQIDEFAPVADGSLSAADRTRFSCVGFDLVVVTPTPAARRTGDSVIIHHGRRPAPPLPPLFPQPPRQPLAFFERGVTRLTLFIAGTTTLRSREQVSEPLLPIFAPFAFVRLREGAAVLAAPLHTRALEALTIALRAHEHAALHAHTADRVALLETVTNRAHAWAFHEQGHEELAVEAGGTSIPTADEQGTERCTIGAALRLRWAIRETRHQSVALQDPRDIRIEDFPPEMLLQTIAVAVASMLEEDIL